MSWDRTSVVMLWSKTLESTLIQTKISEFGKTNGIQEVKALKMNICQFFLSL